MNSGRTVVIGIDGATFRIIDRYSSALPNLAELSSSGYSAELRSTCPDITSVAWPSFSTGQNPGQTGLFDFLDRDPERLEFRLNDVRRRAFDFFWEYLDSPVGIASVPMIPYHSSDGFFIQGSLARVNADRIVNPPQLESRLDDAYGYHIDLSESADRIVDQLLARIESHERVYTHLLDSFDLPLYFFMFKAADFAQHHFWAHAHEDHPLHRPTEQTDALKRIYKRLDSAVGKIRSHAPDDANLVVVSDHGFTSRHTTVNLNALLRREGLLQFVDSTESRAADVLYDVKGLIKRTPLWSLVPTRLKNNVKRQLPSRTELETLVDWSETSAYSFGAGGNVYINLEGREREGIVPRAQYEAVREQILKSLRGLTDPETGDPVLKTVKPRESVYTGSYLEAAPDLVLESANGYYLTAKHGTTVFERQTSPMPNSGMHEREGILLAAGQGIANHQKREIHDIYDVAPTILHAHGETIPDNMDGSVIEPMLSTERPVIHDECRKPERRRVEARVLALRQLGRI